MKNFAQLLTAQAADLQTACDELHTPFAGMVEEQDPFGVIADEINSDHANDNRI